MRISAHMRILIWDAHARMGQHFGPYKYELYIISQLAMYFILHVTFLYISVYRQLLFELLLLLLLTTLASTGMGLFDSAMHTHITGQSHTCIRVYAVAVGCICIWDSPKRVQDYPIHVYCSCCCCCPAATVYMYGTVPLHMGQSHMRMHGAIEQSHAYTSMDCMYVPYVKMRCFALYPGVLDNSQLQLYTVASLYTQLQLYLSQTPFDSTAIDTYSYIAIYVL